MRRKTRQIRVGGVAVGGGAPISIQTMAKAPPHELDRIVEQLRRARVAGCDIARLAVPDLEAVRSLPTIREQCGLPIVADVHFDYRLAVAAARAGADGLRINPGNLGGPDALKAVVDAAGEARIPIRVGVNAGSLPKTVGGAPASGDLVEPMVNTALQMVADIQALGFHEIKVALKAFSVPTTVEANRRFAARSDLPLHLGVTEAGPLLSGAVRSTAALAQLLAEGIGDTLRISLSAEPVEEVRVARVLLQALGLRSGAAVVACPTCGRTHADLATVAQRTEEWLQDSGLSVTVAVMGCEVNGPGEARAADLGIAYGPKSEGLLFERGRIVGRYPNPQLEDVLRARLAVWREDEEKPDGA